MEQKAVEQKEFQHFPVEMFDEKTFVFIQFSPTLLRDLSQLD